MQPGCGAAYPTMIRESYPVDQADDVGTRQIEGTEPGRLSVPALVIFQHIQKTGIKEQILDTGLLLSIQHYSINVCTGTAVPCLGTSLRK